LLGDDVQKTVFAIIYKGINISAKSIDLSIERLKQNINRPIHGKQTLKNLNKKGNQLDSIPVMSTDLRGIQRELNKYGLDYSVRQSLTEKDTFTVYFKSMDGVQLEEALKNYTARNFKKQESIKKRMEAAKAQAEKRNIERQQSRTLKRERGAEER
jgi:hypothetical protein